MTNKAQKFEDTALLQHPEVEKAYDLFTDLFKPAEMDEEAAGLILSTASTMSTLGLNKDPCLVAAALAAPAYINAFYEGDKASITHLAKSFDPLTVQYLKAYTMLVLPDHVRVVDIFDDILNDIFLDVSKEQLQRATALILAGHLSDLKVADAQLSTLDERDILFVLRGSMHAGTGGPVADGCGLEDYAKAGDLRKTEPALMAEIDRLTQKLENAAKVKTSPPPPGPKP